MSFPLKISEEGYKMIPPKGRCLSLPLATFTFLLDWIWSTVEPAQTERHCCLMASVLGSWRSCRSLRGVCHSETAEIYLVFFSSESGASSFETLASAEGLCRYFLSSLWGLDSYSHRSSIQKPCSASLKECIIFSDRERTLSDTSTVCSCPCLCMKRPLSLSEGQDVIKSTWNMT